MQRGHFFGEPRHQRRRNRSNAASLPFAVDSVNGCSLLLVCWCRTMFTNCTRTSTPTHRKKNYATQFISRQNLNVSVKISVCGLMRVESVFFLMCWG